MQIPSGHRALRSTIGRSLLLAVIALLGLREAQSALLFYDGFGYPVGEELGEFSSSTNWGNDKNPFTIVPRRAR
jgi:hypothetical protein